MTENDCIIKNDDLILVTGSNGFIGSRVVKTLLDYGFNNLKCLVRPSSNISNLNNIISSFDNTNVQIISGNLLSRDDCVEATTGVSVIYNLVAGMEKSFSGCSMNSIVTLRNLLESTLQHNCLKRFLHVSSFAVYSNFKIKRGGLLDETCPIENSFMERNAAYCFGKVKQDELLTEYGGEYNIPYVIVRPGVPYGPGAKAPIHARVGIDPFGIFFHLGGSNKIPLTYIDNCADAIVLAGVRKGVDSEVFNIVDDDLPTSRKFLKHYKKNVDYFKSVYIPYRVFHMFCYIWEKYSKWSDGQLPLAFNRRKCAALWRGNTYSNKKLKELLEWRPKVSIEDGLKKHFDYIKQSRGDK